MIDRKSWALGFDDGVNEALREVQELMGEILPDDYELVTNAINKLKGKSNGQQPDR